MQKKRQLRKVGMALWWRYALASTKQLLFSSPQSFSGLGWNAATKELSLQDLIGIVRSYLERPTKKCFFCAIWIFGSRDSRISNLWIDADGGGGGASRKVLAVVTRDTPPNFCFTDQGIERLYDTTKLNFIDQQWQEAARWCFFWPCALRSQRHTSCGLFRDPIKHSWKRPRDRDPQPQSPSRPVHALLVS